MDIKDLLQDIEHEEIEVNFTNGDITAVFNFTVHEIEIYEDVIILKDSAFKPLKLHRENIRIDEEGKGEYIITYPDSQAEKFSTVLVIKIID